MISRKSSILIGTLYQDEFTKQEYIGPNLWERNDCDGLYDFLYERDYETDFCRLITDIPRSGSRAIKDFILGLHTGESLRHEYSFKRLEEREKIGQSLLLKMANDLLNFYSAVLRGYDSARTKAKLNKLLSQLELDGYHFRSNTLVLEEVDVLENTVERGFLTDLSSHLRSEDAAILNRFLEKSEERFVAGEWEDSILNCRKYLEHALVSIANEHQVHSGETGSLARAVEVRRYLEKVGIFEKEEIEALSKVYGLLSNQGGHPYIADQDQARLNRNLALTFAQFALLKFENYMKSKSVI